jgi:hypothetical protein
MRLKLVSKTIIIIIIEFHVVFTMHLEITFQFFNQRMHSLAKKLKIIITIIIIIIKISYGSD